MLCRAPSFTLAYYKAALCAVAIHGPPGMEQAKHLFRCAARLEPANRVLCGNIDLVLRVLSYVGSGGGRRGAACCVH